MCSELVRICHSSMGCVQRGRRPLRVTFESPTSTRRSRRRWRSIAQALCRWRVAGRESAAGGAAHGDSNSSGANRTGAYVDCGRLCHTRCSAGSPGRVFRPEPWCFSSGLGMVRVRFSFPSPWRLLVEGRQCGPSGWRGELHQAHDPGKRPSGGGLRPGCRTAAPGAKWRV